MNKLCNCSRINFKKRNYIYWENRETTKDEIQIIKFLDKIKDLKKKNILHIGIGNSSLAKKFYLNRIVGISVSNSEIKYAKSLKLKNYFVFFCDKYTGSLKKICKNNKFDYIVDTNLKSYSCCQVSFNSMVKIMINSLKRGGKIITSRNGMKWYKKLVPKFTFDLKNFFHFKMKEIEGNKKNILSINELKLICISNNLKLSINKELCYIEK